ncbi:SPOR domain-containing protein, partial [Escherichia coli]|nr:SPOR domain-containing protein [Escherichia coli]
FTPAPAPAAEGPTPMAEKLDKPFIQIGIFSVEENAFNTATSMRMAGILPTVAEGTSQGKPFWRVIVGPATSADERNALFEKIKDLGYNDAYFVTN